MFNARAYSVLVNAKSLTETSPSPSMEASIIYRSTQKAPHAPEGRGGEVTRGQAANLNPTRVHTIETGDRQVTIARPTGMPQPSSLLVATLIPSASAPPVRVKWRDRARDRACDRRRARVPLRLCLCAYGRVTGPRM